MVLAEAHQKRQGSTLGEGYTVMEPAGAGPPLNLVQLYPISSHLPITSSLLLE